MDYVSKTADIFSGMRLIVEGAVVLFEEDVLPLNKLAYDHKKLKASNTFNAIGEALYILRQHIRTLHEAHIKEVARQLAEDDEA